jgi:hypothetical protein
MKVDDSILNGNAVASFLKFESFFQRINSIASSVIFK